MMPERSDFHPRSPKARDREAPGMSWQNRHYLNADEFSELVMQAKGHIIRMKVSRRGQAGG